MATTREIKNKVRSVRNIKKITEAMEAVDANKMRRNQILALAGRPYAQKALILLRNLAHARLENPSPLMAKRDVKNQLVVVMGSDKGLCGSFNSNVIKELQKFASQKQTVSFMPVGKKMIQFCLSRQLKVVERFEGLGDFGRAELIEPIAQAVLKRFLDKSVDKVTLLYTNFLTTLSQKPTVRALLPISQKSLEQMLTEQTPRAGKYADTPPLDLNAPPFNYVFEPDENAVLDSLLPQLVRVQLLQALLESNAAEHSARMVAMKQASDSAGDLLTNLQLAYNKVRQALITREIAEIVSGKEALEGV